ncbi:hypothetical protein [Leucobacter chromiireducens]|uniref:ABC-2 type transport system permease protein n=1 Tax=Leucobacter chromiireducens subsp. chromiireducens TaxID=660067 RepID=A0ABS1SRB5_9MICO|nr:hypothetical protein [Leucobacter chromiireducens]MBL3689451.1 hypothetical protein [Leucobacter chromiireducens subsp. chromiireducens]
MAARLFRLRVALLGGALRGPFGRVTRTIAGAVVLAALAVVAAAAPAWFIPAQHDRAVVDISFGAIVLGAILLVPFFANRGHLEPRQFGGLPAGPGSIGGALLATTVVSWPFFLLALWLLALAVFRPEWRDPAWLAPVALLLAALLAVVSARVTSALAKLLVGDRYEGLVRTIGAVLLVAALPVAVFAIASTTRDGGFDSAGDLADVLGWTPFGAPFAALALGADPAAALGRLAVVGAAILVLCLVWFAIVRASLTRIERPIDPDVARSGLGWFERFPARPAPAIAARLLTYWARDPRYRVALFAIPIAPIFILLALWVAGVPLEGLALVPLPIVLLLLGWSQHNDVAMDSTAIWEHVASGTRGAADRAGRLAPVLLLGVPLALIGSSITVTVMGDWRVLPAVVGMNLGVLFVSAGVSSIFSVMMPYPTTRPGDSPFVQPQWSGSGSGLAQTLSMIAAILLSIPAVWFAVTAITDVALGDNLWAAFFGAGYGLLILVLGILIGGRIFDRSGPELIGVTQVYD